MVFEISKNGFYDLNLVSKKDIKINDNLNICIFDNGCESKKIFVGENTKIEYFLFSKVENDFCLEFYQQKDKSELKVRNIFLTDKKNNFKNIITSKVESNNSKTDILINTIIGDLGVINLESSIQVEEKYKKNECKLKQENIFLGENGSFRGIPQLFIKTDDVIASHSCSVTSLDKELLYYLKSRFIDEKQAKIMMIESIFKKNFSCLFGYNSEKFEEVFLDFKGSI